jgi:hypothetical protein
MKVTGGYLQGYNARAAVNEEQIVLAAEISVDSPDFGHLEPMVDATVREFERAGVAEKPKVAVADAGSWHHDQTIQRATQALELVAQIAVPTQLLLDLTDPRPNPLNDRADARYLGHHSPQSLTSVEA